MIHSTAFAVTRTATAPVTGLRVRRGDEGCGGTRCGKIDSGSRDHPTSLSSRHGHPVLLPCGISHYTAVSFQLLSPCTAFCGSTISTYCILQVYEALRSSRDEDTASAILPCRQLGGVPLDVPTKGEQGDSVRKNTTVSFVKNKNIEYLP